MKKEFAPLLLLALIAILLLPASAYASGYNSTTETTGNPPHGDYTIVGNKCKSCHATHLSDSQYKLLRPGTTNASTACQYCHGATGIVTTKRVWLDANGHGLDTTNQTGDVVVPDDTTYTSWSNDVWGCAVCHAPHANDVVVLSEDPSAPTSSMLLRKFPNPSKPNGGAAYNGAAGSLTVTYWCSNCHEANFGSHTQGQQTPQGVRYGHDSSSAGYELVGGWVKVAPDDGINQGPTCRQCHAADSPTLAGMSKPFPHAGGPSWKMLKSSSTTGGPAGPIEAGKLDKLCAGSPCHDKINNLRY